MKKDAFRLVTVSDLCRVFEDFDAEIKDKLVTAEEPGWNCQFITSKDLSPHLVCKVFILCCLIEFAMLMSD